MRANKRKRPLKLGGRWCGPALDHLEIIMLITTLAPEHPFGARRVFKEWMVVVEIFRSQFPSNSFFQTADTKNTAFPNITPLFHAGSLPDMVVNYVCLPLRRAVERKFPCAV